MTVRYRFWKILLWWILISMLQRWSKKKSKTNVTYVSLLWQCLHFSSQSSILILYCTEVTCAAIIMFYTCKVLPTLNLSQSTCMLRPTVLLITPWSCMFEKIPKKLRRSIAHLNGMTHEVDTEESREMHKKVQQEWQCWETTSQEEIWNSWIMCRTVWRFVQEGKMEKKCKWEGKKDLQEWLCARCCTWYLKHQKKIT